MEISNKSYIILGLIFLFIQHIFSEEAAIDPLLKTSWKQRSYYAFYTPDNQRLGCWSVAFAQILFFHKRSPAGQTVYKGKYYDVSADFDEKPIDLKKIVLKIEAASSKDSKIETARYLWYCALITGKDFGTGNYIGNSDIRRERIEKHFNVKTKRIKYPQNSQNDVNQFVLKELKEKRPLLLFIEGKTSGEEGTGHALVIDGVKEKDGIIFVHLNFGWEGVSDGWYDLWKPIISEYGAFDLPDRWVLAISPK